MADAAGGYARILVPVDLTSTSKRALEYALAFGAFFGSVVDALHVWRSNTAIHVTTARDQAKQQLRDFMADLRAPRGVELRRRTDFGDAYLTILRTAQLSGYDLIVGVAPEAVRARPENVTLALMHTSRVPVLVLPRALVATPHAFDLARDLQRVLWLSALADQSRAAINHTVALTRASSAVVEAFGTSSETVAVARLVTELGERVIRRQEPGELEAALRARATEGGYELCVTSLRAAELGREYGPDHALAERVLWLQSCAVLCERAD